MIDKAFSFALEAHQGQYRKSFKIPYFVHLTEVLKKVCLLTDDQDVWCAAILHDYIEDCLLHLSYSEKHVILETAFNKRIADIVLECSRTTGHESKLQKYQFLESFKEKSMESIVIKICDRRCNVSDYTLSGKRSYASKYALQAYPLYQAYINRQDEDCGAFKFDKVKTLCEIVVLQNWMEGDYIEFNLFDKNIDDRVKEIVAK
jgi:GTP diphosphokinase / guanosine-3',5'-bis(diphosphate) 3'-diphosphatase